MLENPKTPTQLLDGLNIHLSHISRALGELESKKLVKCLTPTEKVGRVYRLTKRGRKVLKMVKELGAERHSARNPSWNSPFSTSSQKRNAHLPSNS